jgi:uncharacterized membrane protein
MGGLNGGGVLMDQNIAGWQRMASIVAGMALMGRGRRTVTKLAGAGLLLRGASGFCPVVALAETPGQSSDTRHALSGPRGIIVEETVVVRRPIGEVYRFWRDLSNLPRVMRHLERVEMLDEGRSRWVVPGPAGVRLEWTAEIINDVENKVIGWRSLEGGDVTSAGSVNFREVAEDSTEVRVKLQYAPPGGHVGAAASRVFGTDAAQQVREDLRSLKQALEAFHAAGAPSFT